MLSFSFWTHTFVLNEELHLMSILCFFQIWMVWRVGTQMVRPSSCSQHDVWLWWSSIHCFSFQRLVHEHWDRMQKFMRSPKIQHARGKLKNCITNVAIDLTANKFHCLRVQEMRNEKCAFFKKICSWLWWNIEYYKSTTQELVWQLMLLTYLLSDRYDL